MKDSPDSPSADDTFEAQRSYLRALAYRMLGSVSDAEDVLQEAFLRWRGSDPAQIRQPRAFLTRVVTRLCLDQQKSARSRRESYVGTWLPEPVPATSAVELADDLSMALLLTLERLSALERAAFLLHDVFEQDYAAVAQTIGRSEAACRQLAARAREHVRAGRPRFEPDDAERERLALAFQAALFDGDPTALATALAEDAVLYSDGGGKRIAALRPIFGRDKILRFAAGIARKHGLPARDQVERVELNGLPGFVVRKPEGVEALLLELHGARIAAIYSIRNPDKLRHLAQPELGDATARAPMLFAGPRS